MVWTVRTRKTLSNSVGYFCIFLFFFLTTYIVDVFYTVIVPSVFGRKEYKKFIFNIILGNWLTINVYFNYIMAWLTSPGLANDYQDLTTQYPMCKKCSVNKPPRTHHCAWCDLCILKFDHHCPWLNSCVGFHNHRYFFQFCCFMAGICFYGATFGYREYQIGLLGTQMFYYKDSLFKPFDILETMGIAGFITYYIFIAAMTIGVSLIGLILWHGRMIGHGVTSLERVLNQDYAYQCHQQGFIFVNPYDFGFIENWKRFFGVRTVGQFILRVLLPSMHSPEGDGITWDGYNVNTNLQSYRRGPDQAIRPVAYPPNLYPNFPGTYPNNRFRPIVPPWEKEPKPINSSNGYQPKSPSSEVTDLMKDR